jgi:uncharacterized protein (TIGR02246 family)
MNPNYLIRKILIVFTLGLFLANCTPPPPPEPVDISSELSALNKEFRALFKNGDAAGVAARYTKDGKLYPPNSEVIEGREAIAAYWQAGMDAGLTDAILTTTSANSYGEVAIEVGKGDIYAGNAQLVDKAKFMVIWKKEDGQWKMYEDIWNTSMPLPTPPGSEEEPGE